MAENSHISWTDHTFNPWIGCTKVGPGCDHCYAENLASRRLGVQWGDKAERRKTKTTYKEVLKWQKSADEFRAGTGRYPRVFSASLADIFDNKAPPAWRTEFWALVRQCDKLQWLIVTKRMPNVAKMLPDDWCEENYRHVVLIITVVNQEEANRDVPRLLAFKTEYPWLTVGLSIEPMLGPVDLTSLPNSFDLGEGQRWLNAVGSAHAPGYGFVYEGVDTCTVPGIDWVITGGESAQLPGERPLVELQTEWVRDVDRQCVEAGVAHHFKQWGDTIPTDQMADAIITEKTYHEINSPPVRPTRVKFVDGMGRSVDGREMNGFPPLHTQPLH